MIEKLQCGCTIDRSLISGFHEKSEYRSVNDKKQSVHHYPHGLHCDIYCKSCDLHRPCKCPDERERRES